MPSTFLHPSLPCPLQVKSFDEEASSLALHPSGYLLLAGFADKLRLMTVLAGGEGCGRVRGSRSDRNSGKHSDSGVGVALCACSAAADQWASLDGCTARCACCPHAAPPLGLCCSPACSCCCVAADDLRVIKELPIKASKDACFSNGGHYFAAVNNNAVHVYCTHTCASLAVLRGHNGKVGACGGAVGRSSWQRVAV